MNYHSRKLLKLNLAPWRMAATGSLLLAGFTVVALRAFYLQGLNTDYLQGKGDAVANRNLTRPAHRGQVSDRHGQLLAISTPVESLWARPDELKLSDGERASGIRPGTIAVVAGAAPRQDVGERGFGVRDVEWCSHSLMD